MSEIWKGAIDNNKACSALLTDISKAFDCLSHDLLIAKLRVHGLDIDSLNILQYYLSNCKKRTKVDSFYSSWEAILSGVTQESIFGPLCLIYLCVTYSWYWKSTYFTGYADDNTPFMVRDNIADIVKALEELGENLLLIFE